MKVFNTHNQFRIFAIAFLFSALFSTTFLTTAKGQSPCGESFDTVTPPDLPAGWTPTLINPTNNGNAVPWQTTTSIFNSIPNSAFAPNPNFVTDNRLDTPMFPAPASLTFQRANNLENGFDGMILEVSSDGTNFQDIVTAGGTFAAGGYNGTISNASGNQSPIQGRAAWTGLAAGTNLNPTFVTTTVNFPAALQGQMIMLRFRVGTDNVFSATGVSGAWIDTITCIRATAASVSISGKVFASGGKGLWGAFVRITDTNGNSRTTRTGSFGYYTFHDIQAGRTHIIQVNSKRYIFAPQIVSVNEDLTEVNFAPQDQSSDKTPN